MSEPVAVVSLEKNGIFIKSSCHKEILASTKGQDLLKDKELNIEAGTAKCSWCKKEIAFPEARVKIFE